MKKFYSIIALCVICVLAGCKKEEEDKTPSMAGSLVGEWQLSKVELKSVTFAGQTVDVYVSFLQDGNFTLYQMIGQGRYRKFTGTWTLEGSTLSGIYSTKKEWGSTYQVSVEENTLVLTSDKGETDTYSRTTIPESVINYSY